ncbi:MAG TPA: metallophosphoesterase family protein [Kiritimatiellia bacterium]|nr:metallophosphoesterase family protein [Kiritimatiellia bacterium]HNS80236.1 metallophosphoesterase family protein [Kiritimatiellia bacterium]HPA77673.1 metallophosphoesterase family protein [Kiritimatiellia bacterium]HQQ03736.1 metallophosphoesterase family protein [Kiritimatiellia bacterium]
MKFALLGDIHSNLEALQAVLKDAAEQGVTDYACMGDIVGYNSNPRECLEIIRNLKCRCVRGNHDHYCSHDENLAGFHPLAADVVDWTRKQLSDDELEFLRTRKLIEPVESFTIVHSTLDTPEMWGYVFDKFEAEANFNYQTTSICFYGHTHVPLAFEKTDIIRCGMYTKIRVGLGKKYFINVGSVGQPRDGDPRAAYVIYNMVDNTVELRRVPYDFTITQEKIRAAGLPARLASRLAQGR